MKIHSRLERQLKKYIGEEAIPPQWRSLIDAVDDAYRQFDDDRNTLERSLDLSSGELLQANSQMNAIFDAFPDLFFRLDAHGTILEFKGGGSGCAHLAGGKMLGKRIQDASAASAQFDEAIGAAQARNAPVSMEYSVGSGESAEQYEARLVPLPSGEIIAILRNISERKEAEKKMLQARDEADRANRAKSEFLSRMSHELRTPMNAILGFAQLLEMETSLSQDDRDSVEQILKGGSHLLELINEVLDISRIEAGRLALAPEQVEVTPFIQSVLALLAPLAVAARVELKSPAKCNGHVVGDPERLKQVLLNLVANAIKFNRPGGSVRVDCDPAPTTTGTGGASMLRIAVTDTGLGIAPDKLDRIFTPFDRLGAEQSQVEGTGLGLALSKRLLEAMGGELGFESVVGQGSTFWLDVPFGGDLKPVPAEERASDVAEPDAEQRSVIYIEDNLSNMKLVERVIKRRPNFKLLTAMQGRLGLDLAREHLPDLVLLDLDLPDIKGGEVLARMREHPRMQTIPVIVISADATPRQIDALMKSGAHAYITKPLNVVELLAAIDGALCSAAS